MEFFYTAEAVDGKTEPKSGRLTATDKQDAEKKVKALFAYPVKVTLPEFAFDLIEAPDLVGTLETSWGTANGAAPMAGGGPGAKS